MNSTLLEDRAVIVVSGEEAGDFLDRILTNKVSDLKEGEGRYAALLTPQGKIVADMVVGFCADDAGAPGLRASAFRLVLNRALAPTITSRLKLLRLRSRLEVVSLAESTDADERYGVVASFATSATEVLEPVHNPVAFFCVDGPSGKAGFELVYEHDAEAISFGTLAAYHAHRIALGIPYGGLDFAYGDAFPHEINMDRLNGVDFKKGCYVGQEVVSRMQHRGTARTRIMKIDYAGGFGPEPGLDVMAGGKSIGTAGYSVAGKGLAMIRLDKLADAIVAGEPITAGGIPAVISAPPYAPDFMPSLD